MLLYNFLRNLSCSHKRLLLYAGADTQMDSKCLSSQAGSMDYSNASKKFNPVTHVIFDMDGLLLDTEVIYKKIITEIAESYGKEYTKDIQMMVLGTTEQSTARIVVEECKLPITVDEFLDKFRNMQNNLFKNTSLMEGAERLVQHLHKCRVPIAVATSSGEKSFAVKIEKHKALFQLFSHVVKGSSDPEVKQGKPAPDIFMICAQRFQDKPDFGRCLVFEDAPNGVTGAVAAGMQVVMVPDADLPPGKTSHATLVLKSLLDFKPKDFGLPPFQET